MAVYHRAYLFDADRCRTVLLPLIRKLTAGRPQFLRDKATEIGMTNSEVWRLLCDYRLYIEDLGHEDEAFDTQDQRIRYWLMVVLASFWRPLDTPRDYVRSVRDAILSIVDDAQFVELLTTGRSVCSLFSERQSNVGIESSLSSTGWCRFGLMGWLDCGDVERQLQRLNGLQGHFSQNRSTPQSAAYLAAVNLMARASREASALFMAIVD